MKQRVKRLNWWRAFGWIAGAAFVVFVIAESIIDPNFWFTPQQQGDALLHAGKFKDAAKVYTDPFRIGVAQYRDGSFEAAAKTFGRVPGGTGAFDSGDALLMHGKYDAAIAAYDRALSLHPGWQEAEENKELAIARKKVLQASGENREEEAADAYEADEIVFDQKGENKNRTPDLAAEGPATDIDLQATWLRRVQTTPGDFLKAKFAYQVAHPEPKDTK
jgi:Ca-activated chloride channel family protein